jgi:hypothetical protein
MSAPGASEMRNPLMASSEINACSGAVPSPAATSNAPTSLRSRPKCVRLVVQPWSAYLRGWGMVKQVFFDGVAVEPGDRAQQAGNGRSGARPLVSRSKASPDLHRRNCRSFAEFTDPDGNLWLLREGPPGTRCGRHR